MQLLSIPARTEPFQHVIEHLCRQFASAVIALVPGHEVQVSRDERHQSLFLRVNIPQKPWRMLVLIGNPLYGVNPALPLPCEILHCVFCEYVISRLCQVVGDWMLHSSGKVSEYALMQDILDAHTALRSWAQPAPPLPRLVLGALQRSLTFLTTGLNRIGMFRGHTLSATTQGLHVVVQDGQEVTWVFDAVPEDCLRPVLLAVLYRLFALFVETDPETMRAMLANARAHARLLNALQHPTRE